MKKDQGETAEKQPRLEEGVDFYFEDGLMVLTGDFLLRRGFCCGNGCRNCPYEGADQRRNSSSSL